MLSPPQSHWHGIHHVLQVGPWETSGHWGTQESQDSDPSVPFS